MTVKLRVDLSAGLLEVEGEEAFVKETFKEFLEQASTNSAPRSAPSVPLPLREATSIEDDAEEEDNDTTVSQRKRSPKAKRRRSSRSSTDDNGQTVARLPYTPKVLKDFDLSGLPEFYAQYDAPKHRDKILLFAVFLRDHKHIDPCSADQIFTCYKYVKAVSPIAYPQAIRDTSNKSHWIDYRSFDDIRVSTLGDRHFDHYMQRKEAAE